MTDVGGIAADRLKAIVARIENMNEEIENAKADLREIYSEAKGAGFDVKILRQIIKLRKIDASDRQEQEAILETYMLALGMQLDMFEKAAE